MLPTLSLYHLTRTVQILHKMMNSKISITVLHKDQYCKGLQDRGQEQRQGLQDPSTKSCQLVLKLQNNNSDLNINAINKWRLLHWKYAKGIVYYRTDDVIYVIQHTTAKWNNIKHTNITAQLLNFLLSFFSSHHKLHKHKLHVSLALLATIKQEGQHPLTG